MAIFIILIQKTMYCPPNSRSNGLDIYLLEGANGDVLLFCILGELQKIHVNKQDVFMLILKIKMSVKLQL